MKRIIAIVLSLVIIITGTGVIRFQITEAEAISDSSDNGEKRSSVNEIKHVQGEALIEISLNAGEDSELIHAGVLASDPTITIKHVMCFDGDKSHPEKKTYIVSVKSGRYSAKSLITKFKKYKNVVRTAYNSCRKMLKSMGNNDPFFKYQWHLGGERFFGEDSNYVKDADLSYEPETKAPADKDVPIVAVVDSGVDYTHEDLKNKMWENPYPESELSGKYGYDCGYDDDDPMPEEGADHGTYVASVIAAETDNGVGISGVSRYAKIMA